MNFPDGPLSIDLAHTRVGTSPRMTASTAVSEPQSHLAAAAIVVGNVDVLYTSRVGRIATAPALELAVDAAVRTAHVHRLALSVERHPPRPRDPCVPHARDCMRARASRLDRCELGLQRPDETGRISFRCALRAIKGTTAPFHGARRFDRRERLHRLALPALTCVNRTVHANAWHGDVTFRRNGRRANACFGQR